MAYYAALVSLVQLLDEIISHPNQQYQQMFSDQERQILIRLHEKLSHLQELLQDHSPKDHKESGDCLQRRIRDAAHQTQDIIESRILDPISQIQSGIGFEEVEEHIHSIVEEVMMMIKESQEADEDLEPSLCCTDSAEVPRSRSSMVAFDEDMVTTLKAQLYGESPKLEVVSIVGMGGIGKTTLAKTIFDDDLMVYHFYCRVWVTVSQNYRMRNVLQAVVESMNINRKELRGAAEEVLKEHIYRYLKGKRYLIVIDDVWDTNVWDDIKRMLPDDSSGSRVMITTRLLDVAVSSCTFRFIHQMQFLDEFQSWDLLCDKVSCPPELEDIGRVIAKNCGGLPLAIVVVAGILSKVNKTRNDWEEISRNISSVVMGNDDHFSSILSLSYNHLPHHLKPCFLYLGLFPSNYEIPIFNVIRLWIAEGFLKPIESKSMEVVAEEYLEDLVRRSLVLITKRKSNGKSKHCCIHDLLRDLCRQRVRYENFFHVVDDNYHFNRENLTNTRHLYVNQLDSYFIEAEECVSHLRSFLCSSDVLEFFLFASGFKLLRVLDALQIRFSAFPIEIVELFHLRYLALDGGALPIPPSISKLENLQTLIVGSWYGAESDIPLPSEIWKMPCLRHVVVYDLLFPPIPLATRLHSVVPALKNLHTLSGILNFICSDWAISMIPNLKKLKLVYTNFPEKWDAISLENVVRLRKLEILDIKFHLKRSNMQASPLPHSFVFPQTLKKLSLEGCRLSGDDLRVVGSLPDLQVLKLNREALVGDEWKPVAGEFSKLKFLQMELYDLKYWRARRKHFPCLEHLQIRDCWQLREIPPEIGDIPTLKFIEVYGSKLAGDSVLKILQEQRNEGNDVLQIRLHPTYRNSR